LSKAVRDRLGVRYCHVASTGRASLTVLLRAVKGVCGPGRDEVVVPSYTCFSVPAAVIKAGLRPRVVDIDPSTLGYDQTALEKADYRRVAAIIATNLYGMPDDMPWLAAFARSHRALLIDDAAQALGTTVNGRASGAWGDAGLLSFDKGKNVSAIEGGAAVTNSDALDDALANEMRHLPPRPPLAIAAVLAKVGVYSAMLRPSVYWIPNALPFLGLGRTEYSTAFGVDRCAPVVAALAHVMMARLDEFVDQRRTNATYLRSRLSTVPGIGLVSGSLHGQPSYTRFPLLVQDPARRAPLVAALAAVGIGASMSYPSSLLEIAELRRDGAILPSGCPGGQCVAERIVTLPTHPYVTARDLDTMVEIVERIATPTVVIAVPSAIESTTR
jgi:dTDP-4-amino-4,6-dideoxygalactose transaminase